MSAFSQEIEESKLSEWANRISSPGLSNVACLVETGSILLLAEDSIGKELTKKLENCLPLSPIVASMLKRIAQHPILRDSSYFDRLPSNYIWLFYLSTLDADELREFIESGQVSADYSLDHEEMLKNSTSVI